MNDHFKEKHSSTPIPQELANQVALRYHERQGTLQLLDKYLKSLKDKDVGCAGSQCTCKTTPFVM